jgi:glycosyltransferase involved in cell wall biosynthesis
LKISVVIPALNEARNIGPVLRAMPAEVDEIVVVDGFSVDGTVNAATAACPDVKIVRQGRRGKGNALAAGFEACSGEYVVMLDADGSMDPSEITNFVAALDAGADYAKGTRFAAGGGSEDITPVRRLGNRALNLLTNVLFRTRYSDLCYGYNAFRRHCIALFDLEPAHRTGQPRWGDGFEIETILNTRVAKAGVRVAEVPSYERNRMHGQSNLRTFRDGTRVLLTILRERFRPARPTAAGRATAAEAAAEPAKKPAKEPATEPEMAA